MTQYDAGPGDWSDREWEVEDRKPRPQAKRRRVTLPPWALLAILVGVLILLCVGLVMIIQAVRDGGTDETPTPAATRTVGAPPTATQSLVMPTAIITQTPTATVVLPIGGTEKPTPATEIAPGITVVVEGTGGAGLNLRAEPTTSARRVTSVKEGTELTVLEGPEKTEDYVWWKLRTPDGKEGWGAARWLVLETQP